MSGAGKNADQINISLPKDASTEIKRRASAMGLSTSRYCYMILQRHLREGAPLILAEDKTEYGKK
jgi:predicted DNA binding CopG/RHH family protein